MRLHSVLWLLLTSHDKSCFNRSPGFLPPCVRETSHGKANIFPSTSPHHLHLYVRVVYWASPCPAGLPRTSCLMMFVFLGAEFCIRLPSDSTSRWTPLPSASGWQRPAPSVDFHHLVIRHAWHTGNPRGCISPGRSMTVIARRAATKQSRK